MTFNSIQYASLFTLVLVLYWKLPRRGQNVLLLVASYAFYAAFDYRFLSLLLISTLFDFWFGSSLANTPSKEARKRWLYASLVVNLGILGFFKYYDFFAGSATSMLTRLGLVLHPPLLRVLLPVGISFYTFHGISYVFDVYRRRIPPAGSLLDYAVFVAFFPQLVAGPIGRGEFQLPQFERDRARPTRSRVTEALGLILIGLFKKVVIADGVAWVVDLGFGSANPVPALTRVIAAYAFTLQIYCDFSGYTDIARGSAWLLGIELPENFRQPYLSRSITEFWRRWHVSLSSWLRDYLYVPLGGNRGGKLATYRNLMLTMLIGGLWHGAAWTFVVWGGLHGFLLAFEHLVKRDRTDPDRRLVWRRDLPSIAATVSLVTALLVVFRAGSLREAFRFFADLASLRGGISLDKGALAMLIAAGLAAFIIDVSQRKTGRQTGLFRARPEVTGLTVGLMLVLIVIYSGGVQTPFIYFRF